MRLARARLLVCLTTASLSIGFSGAEAGIVRFNMKDVARYSSTPPSSIVVTTGEQIPGGINNSAAGNEFNISSLQFDIDGDYDPLAADPSIFFDFQVRTASFVGGQIVFDGFTHVFTAPQSGSYVVTDGTNSYLNMPFLEGEVIGDGVDEFVRDGFSPPGPPNNQTFSVALDEGGVVHQFVEGIDNFVGFKLDTNYYGWIRVQYDSAANSLTFLDGAYDNTGASIVAGDAGSATANADFNGDHFVDGADLLKWQRGLGIASGATAAQGDADASGSVTSADLAIWRQQFGTPISAVAAGAVPEPSTLLLAAGLLIVARRRRD